MKLRFHIALGLGCGLIAAATLHAQSAPPPQKPGPSQQQPAQKPPAQSNPFPEDTNNVPVVPLSEGTAPAPAAPATERGESAGTTSLLHDDTDPAHSPDDPQPGASGSDGFSSSLNGSNDVNIPDEPRPGRHGKNGDEPLVHQVTAKEDEDVAAFELGRKNWRAALSRYQSALITDTENPDVYWGLAEAQRNLGLVYCPCHDQYARHPAWTGIARRAPGRRRLRGARQLARRHEHPPRLAGQRSGYARR